MVRPDLQAMELRLEKMERRKSVSMNELILSKLMGVEKQLQLLREERLKDSTGEVQQKIDRKMKLLEEQLLKLKESVDPEVKRREEMNKLIVSTGADLMRQMNELTKKMEERSLSGLLSVDLHEERTGERDWTVPQSAPRVVDCSFIDSPEIDYMALPKHLELEYEKTDSALQPTIISVSHRAVDNKQDALNLLDILTKSGAIPLVDATLHVVVAATHAFDKSVIDTLVQDSVDPIERMNRSSMMMAMTITGRTEVELKREITLLGSLKRHWVLY